MIKISAKIIGKRTSLIENRPFKLHDLKPPVTTTLWEVIAAIVRREVEIYVKKHEEKKLLSLLSKDGIEQGRFSGRIESGGKEFNSIVELKDALSTAKQAFLDGLYLVFIDDVQYESLEENVSLQEGSSVTFIRLTALSGGYF